jgi:NitT/TauT family transport system ATP-binding protein
MQTGATELSRADPDARAGGLEFVHLSKEFRSRRGKSVLALQDVNVTIGDRKFVAVVGPSGCGKTTLLRLTAGLETPSSGHVQIHGSRVERSRRGVGIMFQTPVLLPWRSALKNVVLPADLTGHATADDYERAHELLNLVGLADFVDHYPRELSGGMQQRVALARALLSDPVVLLLDEPFGALDALTREELNLELMHVWDQRKKTAILITHSISEAIFLADTVVVMSSGPGRVKEVVEIPLPRPRIAEVRYERDFAELDRHITGCLGREAPRSVA